jgi:hypothetical protein
MIPMDAENKYLERMREIATGDESINYLSDDSRAIAEAVVYLIHKRIEDAERDRERVEEISRLKCRVEDLESSQRLMPAH